MIYVVRVYAFDSSGQGIPGFPRHLTLPTKNGNSPAGFMSLGDLDQDGHLDLLCASSRIGYGSRVEFYVDGVLKNTDASAPWTWGWNSNSYKRQTVALMARGYDTLGNVTTVSISVSVK